MKNKKENKQIKIIDKISDKAIKQVEIESSGNRRIYYEWFRYVELVSKDLRKYLN